MNLTLSKRGDYVVRASISLARAFESGDLRKIREVVAEMDVPQTYASQILKDLVRARLATSRAGKEGGYRLVRSPEEISLLDIVEAGEGPLRSERCALGDGPCRWERVCPLHETWSAATKALRETLAATSLADIMNRDAQLEAGSYPIPPDSHRHGGVTITVDDVVQIETTIEDVVRRFTASGPWLDARVEAAYAEVDTLRRSLDPTAPSWMVRSVTTIITPGRRQEEPTTFLITWEAAGSRGSASRFEGEIHLVALDEYRTEARLHGILRPPDIDHADEGDLVDRLSRVTVRSALRRIAHAVEEHPPAIAALHR